MNKILAKSRVWRQNRRTLESLNLLIPGIHDDASRQR